jgi:hypothetical protein
MNISKIKELPKCEAGEFYKYPRTMFEAFPTHVNTELHFEYEPMQASDIAKTLGCLVVMFIVMALI